MATNKTGHRNKSKEPDLSQAANIYIKDQQGKILEMIGLPSCTVVTISFVVHGDAKILKPLVFKTKQACAFSAPQT